MNRTALIMSFISIVFATAVAIFGFRLLENRPATPASAGSWTPENQRALAGKLKSMGLHNEAVAAFERYMRLADPDSTRRANIAYTMGKLLMEQGAYEQALRWFYEAEIADPDTPLKTEMGSKIISCLERLGKYSAADYALNRRTSADTGPEPGGSRVVAEVAGRKIYIEDINEALDAMPEWMRSQFDSPGRKREFLKKYVADELLFRKAIKLEYQKSADIQKRLRTVERELLVNKVVEDELKDEISMEEDDLRNYFAAHRDAYLRKEAVKVSLIKAGLKEVADKTMEELSSGKDFNELARRISLDNETAPAGGMLNRWIRRGEDDLGIGNVAAVTGALFAAGEGEIAGPVEAGGYYYVFRIDKKRGERMPAFDEVAERVKNDYYMHKLKTAYAKLLDRIIAGSEVKLYPEALNGGGR